MIDLITPSYLPSISYIAWLIKKKIIYFDLTDKYNKQTYRNRAEIYGANGKLILTVPIIHIKKKHQLTKDVKIYYDKNWQNNHWKSICSAYRSSPYFEFYEEDFFKFYFEINEKSLFDFNIRLMSKILSLINHPFQYKTKCFNKKNHKKIHTIINAKKTNFKTPKYNQVFSCKHGYINNLSILDVLFNLGPDTMDYLKSINTKF